MTMNWLGLEMSPARKRELREELFQIARHFAGNIVPLCFLMAILLIIHLLGKLIFYNWFVPVLVTLVGAGVITAFEYYTSNVNIKKPEEPKPSGE